MKVFTFEIKSRLYYGQGINKDYVKSALSTKLNVPEQDIKFVKAISKPEDYIPIIINSGISRKIEDELGAIDLLDLNLQQVIDKSTYNKSQVYYHISNILKIKEYELFDYPMNSKLYEVIYNTDLISGIINKMCEVKTYKIPNVNLELPDSSEKIQTEPISRVDEIYKHVRMLLSLDYKLFYEIDDIDFEYKKSKSSYDNMVLARSRGTKISENKKQTVESKLYQYKELYKRKYNRSYSTGFYVSNDYSHANFDDIVLDFERLYRKLKIRINKHYLNNIIVGDHQVTLEELLDSFWVVSRLNNHYIK